MNINKDNMVEITPEVTKVIGTEIIRAKEAFADIGYWFEDTAISDTVREALKEMKDSMRVLVNIAENLPSDKELDLATLKDDKALFNELYEKKGIEGVSKLHFSELEYKDEEIRQLTAELEEANEY